MPIILIKKWKVDMYHTLTLTLALTLNPNPENSESSIMDSMMAQRAI